MNPPAEWWVIEDGKIRCLLCPHSCLLSPGERGVCGVREAGSEKLELPGYGMVTAEASDPIEKKPLYHFHPGEKVWSVGFTGCNLDCPFCQNFRIARADPSMGRYTETQEIVRNTLNSGSKMLAYTYSEPSVHFEYLKKAAYAAHQAGLKNILVTNGNLNIKPAKELLPSIDAANIDIKSWDRNYYKNILGGNLDTVKRFIEEAVLNCWIEITTLIVPGDNDIEDDIHSMCSWIASLSENIPLHLSAYHPAYKYTKAPSTPELMNRMKLIAEEQLNYVYIGNLGTENDTSCPNCQKTVIKRDFYKTEPLIEDGRCVNCGIEIPGVFPDTSIPS